MNYVKKIIGENIFLSPILTEDIELYVKWLNDEKVARGIHKYHSVISYVGEKEFLEKSATKGYNFAILKDENTLIGNCSLNDIDFIDGTATLGIFIGDEENRGKGYGKEALDLITHYGFNHLNLKNIMLKVYEFNKGAIKCYEKSGFKKIGVRTKCHYYDGQYYDEIFMEKLR